METDPLTTFDNSSLADFLRDIMMPLSPGVDVRNFAVEQALEDFSPRDVLNFGIGGNLDLPSFDPKSPIPNLDFLAPAPILQIRQETYQQNNGSGTRTPVATSSINLGAQAFRESLWQWTPAQQDHGYAEQLNMSLPSEDMNIAKIYMAADTRALEVQLDQNTRDSILAMVLSTCEPNIFSKIVSSFPSIELLTSLLHSFLCFHASQTDFWIHASSFQPQKSRTELVSAMIAMGAVLSGIPVIRKLGFAIQEALRLAVPKLVGRHRFPINLSPGA